MARTPSEAVVVGSGPPGTPGSSVEVRGGERSTGGQAARRRSRGRIWAARFVALAADVIQFALLPLVFAGAVSPVDDVIDVATALILTWLLGWHWSFLPTFLAELVPFVDLVPTWTLATWLATRGHDRDLTRP